MRIAVTCLALLVCAPASVPAAEQPAVKKSGQGICHARGSGTYERTRHYEPYDTMDACLASGGRLAKNAATKGDADRKSNDDGSSWLGNIGVKIALIVGMLVIVGGAFLLSRRRAGSAFRGATQEDLERKRWEGNRRV